MSRSDTGDRAGSGAAHPQSGRAPARRTGQPGSQEEKRNEPTGPGRIRETGEQQPGGSAPARRESPSGS